MATGRAQPPQPTHPPTHLAAVVLLPALVVELAVEAGGVCGVQEVDKAVAQVALVAEVDGEVKEVKGAAAGERREQADRGGVGLPPSKQLESRKGWRSAHPPPHPYHPPPAYSLHSPEAALLQD